MDCVYKTEGIKPSNKIMNIILTLSIVQFYKVKLTQKMQFINNTDVAKSFL